MHLVPARINGVQVDNETRKLEPRRPPGTLTGTGAEQTYGSYGSSSSTSSSYGSAYNQDNYVTPSSSSNSNYGSASSYSNYSPQYGNYGKEKHNTWGSTSFHGDAFHVPLAWVVLVTLATFCVSTLITAHQFECNAEGNFANFCRLCINTLDCLWKLVYNLYHCRLNEIPSVTSAVDDDDYTEQELLTMKLRPGIGRALEVEHHKSMMKTAQQIKAVKAKAKANGKSNKNKRGSGATE